MSVQAVGWVFDHSKASGSARLVLLSIANHIESSNGEGWCYVATICREANVSRDSYHRAIKTLVDSGELVREERAGGSSRTRADARPNLFTMPGYAATRPPQDAHPAKTRPPQDAHPAKTRPPQTAHPRPPQTAHPATPADCPPIAVPLLAVPEPSGTTLLGEAERVAASFDRFWSACPYKVGKRAAEKAYRSALKRTTAGNIEAALAFIAPHWEHRIARGDQQYVPHPATWLNRDGWDDPTPAPMRGRGGPPPAPVDTDRDGFEGRLVL